MHLKTQVASGQNVLAFEIISRYFYLPKLCYTLLLRVQERDTPPPLHSLHACSEQESKGRHGKMEVCRISSSRLLFTFISSQTTGLQLLPTCVE